MKKLLVVLLSAALCISMLAGCGNKAEEPASEPEQSQSEASQAESETPAESETSEPAGDVELRDLTIMGRDAFYTYFSMPDSMEEFTAWQALRGLMEAKGINIVPEFVAYDQYQTVLQTRFSSGNDLPMFAYNNLTEVEVLGMAGNGVVLDVNPIIDASEGTAKEFFTVNDFGVTARNKVTTPEGYMYWLPNIYISEYGSGVYGVGTNMTVTIREDWLAAHDMQIPTTLDEYTAALKAFNEAEGNGVAGDAVYNYNPCSLNDAIGSWFGLVAGNLVNVNWDTGEATSRWKQDTFKDYITYVQGLFNEGLYADEMIGSNDTLRQKNTENRVGSYTAYALSTTYEPLIEGVFNPEGGLCYDNIYPIEAVPGVQPLLPLEDPVYVWDQFVFTNKLTDISLGAAFMDVYYSDEQIDLINWGVEGVNYEVVNGEKQYIVYHSDDEGTDFDADHQNKCLQTKADMRISIGKILYARTVCPDMTFYQLKKASDLCRNGWADQKADYQDATVDYGHWTSIDVGGTLATPSAEETEITNNLWNDCYTLSQERIAALVRGEKTVDEIDAIIAELDSVGLQQLIEVYQHRYNRFIGIE